MPARKRGRNEWKFHKKEVTSKKGNWTVICNDKKCDYLNVKTQKINEKKLPSAGGDSFKV